VTAAPVPPLIISGPEALAGFRQGLTGARAFELLDQAGGRLLVTLPVGAGKTEFLVKTAIHARSVSNAYDLVVVLVPRRDILAEILRRIPAALEPVVLEPRPRGRCGELNAPWIELETAGCSLLAKEEVCGPCPRRKGCRWPEQLSRDRLEGVGLILATQHHLALNPLFIHQLRQRTCAERVLVLFDESDHLVKTVRRSIRREELLGFITAQESVLEGGSKPTVAQESWLDLSRLVAEASSDDLQEGRWRFPWLDPGWATDVQRAGRATLGPSFRFPGFELGHFARSDPASRERTEAGDLEFACPTDLGTNFMILSGSIARGLARYRLDPDHRRPGLVSPFEHHRFEHPETRWYNLRSIAGADRYFLANAPSILDFFTAKIAANIGAGRRTLLIAKKRFVQHCATELTVRLDKLGAGPVRVVTGHWDDADLADPRNLPLINYGISGINRFEGHDCAYCLTGYYTSVATIAAAVHDLDPSTERFPVRIEFAGNPARRRAIVSLPDDRETILPQVAQWVLEQKEDNVVVQAVGRVRPFTGPREVITFQVGDLPEVRYTLQFGSLAEARAYFGIPTRRRSAAEARATRARRLKALGLTKEQIAGVMNVSLSSVKRYIRKDRGSRGLI
jgi:hypothetical protein